MYQDSTLSEEAVGPAAAPIAAPPAARGLIGQLLSYDDSPAPEQDPESSYLRPLLIASCATLFVEVLLIRWIGTEVRIFAYFQNLALIACFLGFGLGCHWAARRKSVLPSMIAMLAIVLLAGLPVRGWKEFLEAISNRMAMSDPNASLWGFKENYFAGASWLATAASVAVLATFLLLLIGAMVPLGQYVGFYLDRSRNVVRAYTVNLIASLIGVWLMAGLAFRALSPEFWFALAFLMLMLLRPPTRRMTLISVFLGVATLGILWSPHTVEGFHPTQLNRGEYETRWSPYQKLQLLALGDDQYLVAVNNTGYMTIYNVTPPYLATHPRLAAAYPMSSYDAPFRFVAHKDRVLIVGAGAGNDVAAALRNGAGEVDAVEIDPVIYALGRNMNPQQPYQSPRVHVTINDARNFMRQTHNRYDVIIFGLLDSHTTFSDFSNMRVDNYVYTEQSFRQAERLLKPDGVLILKFEVRAPWLWMGQRFWSMLGGIFGRPPVTFFAPAQGYMLDSSVFVESHDPALWERAQSLLPQYRAVEFPTTTQGAPPPTTDDWPYVYQNDRAIPRTYLTVSILLIAMALLLVRGKLNPRLPATWQMFFLGAGFLLLETQLVSRLALYFGTTWIVNSVGLTALLLVLVLANFYVSRMSPENLAPYYGLLVLALLANYWFPWDRLPYGARTVGMLLAGGYAMAVFFAGIIFTETFRRCEHKAEAFGANIVGSVAGGLAQNAAFVIGMKALLLLAVIFYGVSAVCAVVWKKSFATS